MSQMKKVTIERYIRIRKKMFRRGCLLSLMDMAQMIHITMHARPMIVCIISRWGMINEVLLEGNGWEGYSLAAVSMTG